MRRLLTSLALSSALLAGPATAPAATGSLTHGAYTRIAGPTPGRVRAPGAIATAPDGRIAVADGGVTVLAADGSFVFAGVTPMNTYGVAFAPDGSVYAGEDGTIHHFAADGHELAAITDGLTAHGMHLRPQVVTVGGDGLVHAYVDDQLMTWNADGVRVRATPQPAQASFAADPSGEVFRGGEDGIDLLATDDTVAKHVTDAYGQVSVDPAGHLRVLTNTDFVTYDGDLNPIKTVPVTQPPPTAPEGIHSFAVTAAGDYLTTSVQIAAITRQGPDGTALAPFGADRGTGLFSPTDIAGTPDGGVLVADSGDRRVTRFTADGTYAGTVWDPGLRADYGVAAFSDGDALVTAVGPEADEVARYGPDGTRRWSVGIEVGNARHAAAAVAPDGTAWVRTADGVVHFGGGGELLGSVPFGESGDGLAIDGAGRLYLTATGGIAVLGSDGLERARLPTSGYPYAVATSVTGRIADTDGDGWNVLAGNGTPLLREYYSTGLQRSSDLSFAASGEAIYLLDDAHSQVLRTDLTPLPAASVTPAPSVTPTPTVVARTPKLLIAKPVHAVRVRKGRATLGVRCTGAACRGRLTLAGTRVKVTLAAGRTARVKVRLPRKTRRALRRHARLRVTARTAVTGGTGDHRRILLRR